ncbi:type I restriction enzyme M protein [Streptomyces sp. SAI-195]|uniref:HsdM family class I SAM-dependent methyltransferase n=2 Tax=unclassified Streptomyces TaxID=2593676 RepID=UPI003C7BC2D5
MPDTDSRLGEGGDDEFAAVLVSRPDIARMAGVKRPAVSNWERRYPDYPAPVAPQPDSGPEQFRAGEVMAWLSGRTVPVNALLPGEPTGTTYGDRFRVALTGRAAGGLLVAVRELTGPGAERMRGSVPLPLYLNWLLFLVHCAIVEDDGGTGGRRSLDQFEQKQEVPEGKYPRGLPAALQDLLDRNPPSSPEEARQAFDLVLGLLRDADAREGGDFLTPPSVSRTMAGALAAVQPLASMPHDPYCRTGELLTAYLDAAAARGGEARSVSGRVLHERDLRNATMNLRVHGAEPTHVYLAKGPFTPAIEPMDPPGSFDTVLTNPPFARRLPDDAPPPPYWTYGPARRTEFDWLQYAASLLTPQGRAAVLMPAGAAFNEGAARTVRTGLVENGVVECVMALPARLFEHTAISTHIWFLRAPGVPGTPEGKVLFVDATDLGHSVSRARHALADGDIARLVQEYASWCRAGAEGHGHPGTPGLSRVVTPAEITAHDNSLNPLLYTRTAEMAPPPAVDLDKAKHRLGELAAELDHLDSWALSVQSDVNRRLRRYGL